MEGLEGLQLLQALPLYWVNIGLIWVNIGIMENQMENEMETGVIIRGVGGLRLGYLRFKVPLGLLCVGCGSGAGSSGASPAS